MRWEVWDAVSGNAIADFETEAEAVAAVRSLVEDGWKVDEILLIPDDPDLPVEAHPPAVTGDELSRRAGVADVSPTRRTA
jgi:hypothetical protein